MFFKKKTKKDDILRELGALHSLLKRFTAPSTTMLTEKEAQAAIIINEGLIAYQELYNSLYALLSFEGDEVTPEEEHALRLHLNTFSRIAMGRNMSVIKSMLESLGGIYESRFLSLIQEAVRQLGLPNSIANIVDRMPAPNAGVQSRIYAIGRMILRGYNPQSQMASEAA